MLEKKKKERCAGERKGFSHKTQGVAVAPGWSPRACSCCEVGGGTFAATVAAARTASLPLSRTGDLHPLGSGDQQQSQELLRFLHDIKKMVLSLGRTLEGA